LGRFTIAVSATAIPHPEVGTLLAPFSPWRKNLNRACKVLSITILYLLLVIVLPLGLSLAMGYRGLPHGRSCPLCTGETLRLRSRWLQPIRLGAGQRLHSRWCPTCGWEGLARVREPASERTPARSRVAPGTSTEMVELSELSMDGRPWRVLLQAWSEAGVWRGQLLFVGPVGRIFSDGLAPFSGESYREILRQAMALSENVLAVRLRGVLSDF
jgi:hypothetical protein